MDSIGCEICIPDKIPIHRLLCVSEWQCGILSWHEHNCENCTSCTLLQWDLKSKPHVRCVCPIVRDICAVWILECDTKKICVEFLTQAENKRIIFFHLFDCLKNVSPIRRIHPHQHEWVFSSSCLFSMAWHQHIFLLLFFFFVGSIRVERLDEHRDAHNWQGDHCGVFIGRAGTEWCMKNQSRIKEIGASKKKKRERRHTQLNLNEANH